MALSGLLWHIQGRSHFNRRNVKDVPRLIGSPSTNTTSIAAGASMDFPHGRLLPRDYPKITHVYLLLLGNLFTKDFFLQTIDATENIKVCG